MTLDEARSRLEAIEPDLPKQPITSFAAFERNGRRLHVYLTERFRHRCRRGRVWRSAEMLTALKNAEYGFDPNLARSRGGRDGLFLLDRTFKPANSMMHKIFDRYLDSDDPHVDQVASSLEAPRDELRGARLVSHHMRLLGVLLQSGSDDHLVLVDYDDE